MKPANIIRMNKWKGQVSGNVTPMGEIGHRYEILWTLLGDLINALLQDTLPTNVVR
jgi:hypothetical protein